MHTLFGGKSHKIATVEIDAIIVYQIRVFLRVHAVGRKVNLLFLFIDMLYSTHIPCPLGYLACRLTTATVVEVEMVVIVPFARPDDAPAVLQVMTVYAGVVDIFLLLLFDKRFYFTGYSRKFQQAIDLMAPLVILKREGTAVALPTQSRHLVRG